MAKGRKGGQGRRSGGGMLTGMRKGFRGMVHGESGKPKQESAFWNVLFYLAAGLLAAMLVYRWVR
jgi:hypothetical protein